MFSASATNTSPKVDCNNKAVLSDPKDIWIDFTDALNVAGLGKGTDAGKVLMRICLRSLSLLTHAPRITGVIWMVAACAHATTLALSF
jgi:hypothetical protein